jgi:hypothetical protein
LNNNVLFYPLVSSDSFRRLIDNDGIGFSINDGNAVNLYWGLDGYYAFASNTQPYGNSLPYWWQLCGRSRTRTFHLGHDDPRLCWRRRKKKMALNAA